MTEMESEKEFASYLDDQGLVYEPDYHIGPGDFDFCIDTGCGRIYCDVKEIQDSNIQSVEGIDAHLHLRGDIRKLRNKYKGKKVDVPVVLVAMNYSSNYFTGLTVGRALMGNVGLHFRETDPEGRETFTPYPKGQRCIHNNKIHRYAASSFLTE
jgi:hypothetical protein